jgi:hypothetical protein
MVEATPATWRDLCERCGRGFNAGESRWIEQRRYLVHTQCAQWELWDAPPYSWKLRELRKQYRQADANSRARIVKAGTAIRAAQAQWPTHAVAHVQRVLEAVHRLG